MKRTLEKLAQERQEIEQAFQQKLDKVKGDLSLLKSRRSFFRRSKIIPQRLLEDLTALVELQAALIDAKDKEWDALGSHHVGLIFKSLEWRVDGLAAEAEDAKSLIKKFVLLRENLDRLLAALEARETPDIPLVKEIRGSLEDCRYAGFERRFRGRPEDVKAQLRGYLPYFSRHGTVLDLGCGRGEFLELLRESGIEGRGIDINSEMVSLCLEKGLDCEKGDMLEKLAECEDASIGGIFSSQVIEHLSPAELRKLIELSRRKLVPGGVIVLETINPTSVFALVQIFYLDFSHQKPVHPQALKYLLETEGFADVRVIYSSPLEEERLQNLPGADERTAILNRNIDALNDLLFAPPNYAAVAKKA